MNAIYITRCVSAVTACLLASAAFAADPGHTLGTPAAAVAAARLAGPNLPVIVPAAKAIVYSNAQYGTGGVALRNRQLGVMHVSGVTGPVQAAYVYWAYLFTSTPPTIDKLTLKNVGTNVHAVVAGRLLATGADPCWGSSGTAVYRATVPLSLVSGNGLYQLTLTSNESALNTGDDPWVNTAFPAAEGASMVIVGTGSYTVGIYDTAIPSGTEWSGALNYTLKLPVAASGSSTLWDSIGADGQLGDSRTATASGETTTINGVAVAGPGASNVNSDWDGSSGWPLPQLWDDTGHDITAATPYGTKSLNVSINSPADCLVTIANVVAVQ
jgi:hypothetical protein